MHKFKVIGAICIVFLLFSCQKQINFDKIKPITYNGDWAAPLAYGNFSIEDILEGDSSSYFFYGSDGLIHLTYTGELVSLNLDDLIPNNKTTYSVSINLTSSESAQLAGTNSLAVYFNQVVTLDDLNTNGVAFEMDSVEIKSGIFDFSFNSRIDHKITLELDIPALKLNGIPFNQVINIDENSNNNIQIDVSGYNMDLTKGGTTHSTFDAAIKATIIKGPSANYAGGIDVDLEIKNGYKIKTAYGDALRQDFLALNNTNLDIELFDFDEIGKTIFMEDATIKFLWKNSFGVPIEVVLDNVTGLNKKLENFTLDVTNVSSSEMIITAPSVVGQETSGEIVINNSKTQTGSGRLSLKDFINENINKLNVDAQALSNPVGVPRPPSKNFINENSALKIDIEASIPLHGRALGYAFRDTFDMDIGAESDEIEKASIKLYSENGFPIDLLGSFAFLDENDKVLFVIDNSPEFIFKAAEVDANGKSIKASVNDLEIVIEDADLSKLGLVKKISIIASFSTSSQGTKPVKFFKDDRLSVKIGARVKVKTEI